MIKMIRGENTMLDISLYGYTACTEDCFIGALTEWREVQKAVPFIHEADFIDVIQSYPDKEFPSIEGIHEILDFGINRELRLYRKPDTVFFRIDILSCQNGTLQGHMTLGHRKHIFRSHLELVSKMKAAYIRHTRKKASVRVVI